jgi:hypothetical protein
MEDEGFEVTRLREKKCVPHFCNGALKVRDNVDA